MAITLLDCYNADSSGLSAQISVNLSFSSSDAGGSAFDLNVHVKVSYPWHSDRPIYFIYVPESVEPTRVLYCILMEYKSYAKLIGIQSYRYIDFFTSSVILGVEEIPPSDVIYVYAENYVVNKSAFRDASVENSFAAAVKRMGISVYLRDEDYRSQRETSLVLQAFISHDSRDKDAIARPIAMGLESKLYKVWYDDFSLELGGNLRESIERGIRESRKCVLIITKNFLNNPGWTKREFDSIFTREMIKKENVILPIWFNVSADEVYEYSPSLANTVALHWPDEAKITAPQHSDAVQKIIDAIIKQLGTNRV